MNKIILRLLLSNSSWHGRKIRSQVLRLRRRRATNYARSSYNAIRQNYYNHFLMKQCPDETGKVSIIVPCFNTPVRYFEPLLASVFAQTYSNWELIMVDASSVADSASYLSAKSRADTRIVYIKTKNEGIGVNTNKGLAVATGDYIAFLDHDDTLDPNALAEMMSKFYSNPLLGMVYSDEDKVSDDGERYFDPHFKPGFSLDMLRNVNYITHFVVAKKSVVDEVGGIREGYDGAQDYDFLLRIVDTGVAIGHVPKILYHWREADGSTAANFSNKQHVTRAGCWALEDHYRRRKIVNLKKVEAIASRPGFYRAYYRNPTTKLKIFLNLNSARLSDLEKNTIVNFYKANKDVKKFNIQIIEGDHGGLGVNANTLLVNGTFIPANDNTDIVSLFMLASETGVASVAPKIVRHGRIFDMGIVYSEGTSKKLFKNLNPEKTRGFGSLEWVRNVDAQTGNVQIRTGHNDKADRNIIWTHSEFTAFETENNRQANDVGQFYNPNIVEVTEMFEASADYISDFAEIDR